MTEVLAVVNATTRLISAVGSVQHRFGFGEFAARADHLFHSYQAFAANFQHIQQQYQRKISFLPEDNVAFFESYFREMERNFTQGESNLTHIMRYAESTRGERFRRLIARPREMRNVLDELTTYLENAKGVLLSLNTFLATASIIATIERQASKHTALPQTVHRSFIPNRDMGEKYKVFLSHAGEDKRTMALPSFRRLQNTHDIHSFVDAEGLWVGDNAPQMMEWAMETADIGVFILSEEFVGKEWPMKELLCFQRRQTEAFINGSRGPVLVPIFYRLSLHECKDHGLFQRYRQDGKSLFLENGFFDRMENGIITRRAVQDALAKLSKTTGVENKEMANNSDAPDMLVKRERLLETICDQLVTVVKSLPNEIPDPSPPETSSDVARESPSLAS